MNARISRKLHSYTSWVHIFMVTESSHTAFAMHKTELYKSSLFFIANLTYSALRVKTLNLMVEKMWNHWLRVRSFQFQHTLTGLVGQPYRCFTYKLSNKISTHQAKDVTATYDAVISFASISVTIICSNIRYTGFLEYTCDKKMQQMQWINVA